MSRRTADFQAYEPVTRYRTVDGALYTTPDKARSSAEDGVARELREFLRVNNIRLGAPAKFKLVQALVRHSAEVIGSLQRLHVFEVPQ